VHDSDPCVLLLSAFFPFKVRFFGNVWRNESGVDVVYCFDEPIRVGSIAVLIFFGLVF
jgi:hypothetical protein